MPEKETEVSEEKPETKVEPDVVVKVEETPAVDEEKTAETDKLPVKNGEVPESEQTTPTVKTVK